MNVLLKSWSYRNKTVLKKYYRVYSLIVFFTLNLNAQIGNYISNGSFEADCSFSTNPIYWPGIDSLNCDGGSICSECPLLGNAPANGLTYQKARTGGAYIVCTFFQPNVATGYLKNRLRQKLKSNETYCVKFYVNISNNSTYGIDAIGIFFANNSLDTINYCSSPLTYIVPQVTNPSNTIITDTLQWTLITGTFIANGNEKYALIGNFKADTLVNKTFINPTNSPLIFTDVCIDDVSCIPLNLPAYAGPDKSLIPGDSVFIGREPDFAIDPGCVWYKLPNLASPIATISGMWVKPTQTTSYLVKQVLDCSPEKWDTVVVYMNPLGLNGANASETNIELYPNPADDAIEVSVSDKKLLSGDQLIRIYNHLGLLVKEEKISFDNTRVKIKTEDLPNGVYSLKLKNGDSQRVSKRFVIAH